jgi:hypothetical protein
MMPLMCGMGTSQINTGDDCWTAWRADVSRGGINANVFVININGIFDLIDVDDNDDVADSCHCHSDHCQCSQLQIRHGEEEKEHKDIHDT